MTHHTITKPVIIFDFVYEVRTKPKSDNFDITHDHPKFDGTIAQDGSVLYPSIEDIKTVLNVELITGHGLKTFKLDQSTFSVFNQANFKYTTFDFNSLPILRPGDPKELIDGIRQYVIDRAMKRGGK